jgi:hypothetical protein
MIRSRRPLQLARTLGVIALAAFGAGLMIGFAVINP